MTTQVALKVDNEREGWKRFEELGKGDFFVWGSNLFIKINVSCFDPSSKMYHSSGESKKFNAIRLLKKTGSRSIVSGHTLVQNVDKLSITLEGSYKI